MEKNIMKIAFIRRKFDINGGGAEKVAANFVSEFISRGHSITVFAEKFNAEKNENLQWVKIPSSIISLGSKTSDFHGNVQKKLKHSSFDIVYSMCRTYPVDVFRVTEQLHAEWMPIQYSKFAKLNPRHRSILTLEKKLFNVENVRHVVTNSELVKKQINERFSYPSGNISVIRNGIDRKKFSPPQSSGEKLELRKKLGLPANRFILLFVAGNFRIKGLEQAIMTLAGLNMGIRKNTILLVAGGDNPQRYIKQAESLGVENNIIFGGASRNMRDFYAASDMLFYPSMYEPFANVCLEASACALPVLTTALNGSSELFKNRTNGYIVSNHEKIEDMKKYITDFYNKSEQEKKAFSEASFKASEAYSWNKHAEELETLFGKILAQKKQ